MFIFLFGKFKNYLNLLFLYIEQYPLYFQIMIIDSLQYSKTITIISSAFQETSEHFQ